VFVYLTLSYLITCSCAYLNHRSHNKTSKKKSLAYHALLMICQACWDDNFNGRQVFQQTDFLHSPLLDELKALETRVLAEFAVNLPSALVVDRYAQVLNIYW